MRRAATLMILVVACTAPACGSDGSSSADDSPGLVATVQESTLFATHRELRLAVRNEGDGDVTIGTIQLATPLFEEEAPVPHDVELEARGRQVVMGLPYGTAVCGDDDGGGDGAGGDDDRPAELVTTVDGDEARVALDEHPTGVLRALHDDECAARAVLDRVDVRLGDDWERTGERAVTGDLVLEQRDAGVTAEVDELFGNVIFTVAAGDPPSPWLAIDDETTEAAIPVTLDASRCDPHALTEYKRTFVFSASVRLGDDEPIRLDVTAEGAARAALEPLLALCVG